MKYTFNTIAFIASLYAIATYNLNLISFLIIYWFAVVVFEMITIVSLIYEKHKKDSYLKKTLKELQEKHLELVRRYEKEVFKKKTVKKSK